MKSPQPSHAEKLKACGHYSEFDIQKWDWRAPTPPGPIQNWDAESWVKWIDAHGSWVLRKDFECE